MRPFWFDPAVLFSGRRSLRARRHSDSDSAESEARRSLSLASSHSSDDEEIGNGSAAAASRLHVEERPPVGAPREYSSTSGHLLAVFFNLFH